MSDGQSSRDQALGKLARFVGTWGLEASFPALPAAQARRGLTDGAPSERNGPAARTVFEWILNGQFLLQRAEIPDVPTAPDVHAIIGVDRDGPGYLQHYFDSRGVARVYAMTLDGDVWRLVRSVEDFSPLNFWQRFTGTFSEDGGVIRGAWETSPDGSSWEHDFDLTYTRLA